MSTTTSRTEGSRHGRVIHGESTLEIPVHLLFRDDPGGAAPAPGAPEVRLRPVPTMPAAPSAPPVPAAASVPSSGGDGPGGRSARMLPGALGVLAGVCGATGCLLTSWWAGVLPPLAGPVWPSGTGLGPVQWAAYAGAGALGLAGFVGLARGRARQAGERGRTRARPRHWRSEPVPVCDANGLELSVTVLVTWRFRETARALRGVGRHRRYLAECVEAALARLVPQVPVGGSAARAGVTLRDAGALGDALAKWVAQDVEAVGLEVCAVRVTRVAYVTEVAEWLRGRRMAELEG
ncbi:SPFH domain-containing protein [Streptomyces griseoaurantiacus]|uniref:SPFH domain-containing protein n=1 Tax=Streptomyces griseoaurantiacus TaxID=68213 RepID=UPI00177EB192|nr:SPFH domain-containing protein [Streptomyces jietaisiensis]GHE39343.1 membrane protein [Streptomyces griseoaurantiacus]